MLNFIFWIENFQGLPFEVPVPVTENGCMLTWDFDIPRGECEFVLLRTPKIVHPEEVKENFFFFKNDLKNFFQNKFQRISDFDPSQSGFAKSDRNRRCDQSQYSGRVRSLFAAWR